MTNATTASTTADTTKNKAPEGPAYEALRKDEFVTTLVKALRDVLPRLIQMGDELLGASPDKATAKAIQDRLRKIGEATPFQHRAATYFLLARRYTQIANTICADRIREAKTAGDRELAKRRAKARNYLLVAANQALVLHDEALGAGLFTRVEKLRRATAERVDAALKTIANQTDQADVLASVVDQMINEKLDKALGDFDTRIELIENSVETVATAAKEQIDALRKEVDELRKLVENKPVKVSARKSEDKDKGDAANAA